MKKNNYYIHLIFSAILFLGAMSVCAQKINTDSLLVSIISDMKTSNNYQKNIEKCLLGKKIAPEYLDFQLLLGRNYEFIKQNDSARYYYKKVIDKNTKYEEAFLYLINLDINEKKYDDALTTTEKAITVYKKSIIYYQKRTEIYGLLHDRGQQIESLKNTLEVFPNDTQTLSELEQIIQEDRYSRIGINYNYTAIDRKEIGPWHLLNLEYINNQIWGAIIGRISYAERYATNNLISKGIQYEVESYYKNNKRSYTYFDATYSTDIVFPKFKLGGSFYLNFEKGWETDLGLRFIKTQNLDITTLVAGVTKTSGPYWISLRAYLNNNKKEYNPVISLNNRYYFNSKYDYAMLNLGFGTSPDERTSIAQLQNRLNLKSYRMGVGYNKLLYKKFITGIQINYNYQEYIPEKYQNEYELSLLLHYKF
jgi:YaiO family outer membrane protein